MKIIVDADSIPKTALNIAARLSAQYQIPLLTIASFNHQIQVNRAFAWQHKTVGNADQETDLAVVNLAEQRDIAITQDYGLAALLLARKVAVLSPHGRIFHSQSIEFLLEERELKARFRRNGGRTRGPLKRTAADDQKFQQNLQFLLDNLANGDENSCNTQI
ncbi:MAG: DUF188 domain-containing protein [Clostridia bacterium]|nr:DUF188 domain-containing protein [Clostridia bacterium]